MQSNWIRVLRQLSRRSLVIGIVLGMVLVSALSVRAASTATDFEGFSLGSVNGQNGWLMTGPFDVEVVNNSYGYASFETQSLRISNAVTSGSFGDQLFSVSLADEAGESTADNNGFSGGVRQPFFQASWDIASTVPGAEQPGLQVTASPDRGDGARMSWIQVADTPGGLEVNFYDFNHQSPPDCSFPGPSWRLSSVANGLDRTVPHNVKVTMEFSDGINDDKVNVYVDGTLVHTGLSWEDYFRDCESNPTRTVDSILFRVAGTAAPATSGNGFLIDNFATYSGPVSETTVVVDPSNTDWIFLEETPTASGGFVNGPATPPAGSGSAEFTLDDTGGMALGTALHAGTYLRDINTLTYHTYRQSGGVNLAPALQFNIDYDLTDGDNSWQGRLVYEPVYSGATPSTGVWEAWDTLAADAKWWATGGPGVGTCIAGAGACTIGEILANWPNAGIHAAIPGIGFKAGGGWTGGFVGNVDDFTIQVHGDTVHYNFESCPGGTVTNQNTGATYCTIQAAIDAAASGETILVGAGTYAEVLSITTDGLTLIGDDEATVIIDATAATNYHFTVNASNTTLKNFTLNGNPSASYGLKISGLNATTRRTNVVLENITVQDTGRSGIDINGLDGVTIDNVTVKDVPGGVGLALSDVVNATIDGVTTSNNAWGGTAIYTNGVFYPGGADSIVLANISGDEPVPLYLEVANNNLPVDQFPITNVTLPVEYTHLVTNVDHRPNGENFYFFVTSETNATALAAGLNTVTDPDNTASKVVPLTSQHVSVVPSAITTIQAAIDSAVPGTMIFLGSDTFAENLVVDRTLSLIGAGAGTDPALYSILDGTGLPAGSGIFVNAGVTDVLITELTVRNYVMSSSNDGGIVGFGGNNNFTLQNAQVLNNSGGRAGVYLNGPVDTVLIDNVTAHNNQGSPGRGIVIWNGYKSNITITNNDVRDTNCCGIELQDGTASGVTISGNTVVGNGDSGMSAIGLTSGAGPYVTRNNTVTNNGRFGIEIKNPDGSGLDTGDGSIVVENNTVSFVASSLMNIRDHAGIAVFRRSFIPGNPTGYVDVPTGVIVRNNTVSGYIQQNPGATTSEGFGIVVEGVNHTVTGNTLQNNEIGIQEQGGNHPNANYVPNDAGDGDQADGASPDYFGRGNSPLGCGNTIGSNTFTGNTIDYRKNAAGGGLVTNVNTGEIFCSIQAAIDDVDTQNGHTITIAAGTYAEAPDVNKELTIQGVDRDTVIVDASAVNDYSLHVTADNVTLSQFTVEGNPSFSTAYGIFVNGVNNFTIEDVKVQNSNRTGVNLNGVNTATLNNVEATGAINGNGMALSDCNDVSATNLTTSGNAWGGFAIYTYGEFYPLGSDNVTIGGTNSFGEPNKVYVEVGNFSNPASPEPVTNLTVDGFEYIVRNDTFRPGGANFSFYQITRNDAVALALGLPTPNDSYVNKISDGTFWVGTDGTNDMKIQAAVNHVGGANYVPLPVSNMINVLAGDYEEEVTIDRNVVVQGESQATTTIHPTKDTGTSGDARAWWLVDTGAVLDLSDVTFDGTGYKVWQAIRNKGSGSVTDVAFDTIQYQASGSPYQGMAIAAFGDGPVDVSNSTFTNIGRVGVLYFGTGVAGSTFSGNTYTGKGDGDFLDYALDISAGATVDVTGNTISANRGVASSDGSASAGILVSTLFGGGTSATITGNTISNSTTAVDSGYDGDDTSTTVIVDNTFTDNENGVSVRGSGATTTVKGNTITDSGNTGVGVNIFDGAIGTVGADVTGEENTISGFATGVRVAGGGASTIAANDIENNDIGVLFEAGATSALFQRNNISGNTTAGAENQSANLIDATLNWWGDASGPSGDGTGAGDAILETVSGLTVCSWLNAPYVVGSPAVTGPTATTSSDGHTTQYCTIEEAMFASNGANQEVHIGEGNWPQETMNRDYSDAPNLLVKSSGVKANTVLNGVLLSGSTFDGLTFDELTFSGTHTGSFGNYHLAIRTDGNYKNLAVTNSVFDGQDAIDMGAISINRGFDGFTLDNNVFQNYANSVARPGIVNYSLVFIEAQTTATGDNYVITNNTFNGVNHLNSVEAYRWNNVTISDNTIAGLHGRILVWSDGSEPLTSVTIESNLMNVQAGTADFNTAGIGVYYVDAPTSILGNTITGPTNGMVLAEATDVTLKGNTVIGNGGVGIGVNVAALSDVNIGTLTAGDNNDISGFETGIQIEGTATVLGNLGTITDNTVGINVADGGTSSIRANDIEANGTGVNFEDGATSNELFCNNILDNTTDIDSALAGTLDAEGNYFGPAGPAVNGAVDTDPVANTERDGTNCDVALAVTLGYFHAVRIGDEVSFTWQTTTEAGNAGFLLFGELERERTQITTEMLPSAVVDSTTPTSYSYRAVTDAAVFYLEEIRIDGNSELYGPYELGVVYGQYQLPANVELEPAIYLPVVTGE